eukprot:TRINITY_DN4526_c0_g1_i1.p1 TRINITY_DN4526_c0_g1~~TRINITY_DN4526_c0_g1_i1.p1  ORF type:complete len:345 (-),score=78.19 TRINITY_DN4526_c0_g1_i1:52-1002(-)
MAQQVVANAAALAAESGNHSRKKLIKMGEITWGKFEDGMPNLFIRNVEQIRGRDVVYLVSFLNPTEFVSQFSVLYALPRYLVKSLVIVLPYFPTGTMERVEEEGQIATAMTFAQLLCATPIGIGGPARLVVYDLHSLANRFYFNDNVIPLLVSGVPLFLRKLNDHHHSDNTVIAFPDDGAHKRFGKMFKNFPVIICIKVREGEKRIVTIKEGQEFVKDAHVFIVDDLVKTGGTLRETKDKLLQAGAKKVSCYVTHAVFPQESWKKFTYEEEKAAVGQFSHFYTTDSVPDIAAAIKDKRPFEILPLAASIVENVLKY